MARRIMSMKNSSDTTGNRTRDLPTCSAVPQPTAPPRTALSRDKVEKLFYTKTVATILTQAYLSLGFISAVFCSYS